MAVGVSERARFVVVAMHVRVCMCSISCAFVSVCQPSVVCLAGEWSWRRSSCIYALVYGVCCSCVHLSRRMPLGVRTGRATHVCVSVSLSLQLQALVHGLRIVWNRLTSLTRRKSSQESYCPARRPWTEASATPTAREYKVSTSPAPPHPTDTYLQPGHVHAWRHARIRNRHGAARHGVRRR